MIGWNEVGSELDDKSTPFGYFRSLAINYFHQRLTALPGCDLALGDTKQVDELLAAVAVALPNCQEIPPRDLSVANTLGPINIIQAL